MSSNLIIESKQICVPGEIVATGMDFLPSYGTSREGEKIIANKLGIVNVNGRLISVIPVSGKYMPKRGDTVIGRVFDITMSGWRININCAYSAMLMVKDASSEYIPKNQDLTKLFDFDDLVVAKIENVTSQFLIDLSLRGPGLRKLTGGITLNVTPSKVPRIIGKNGSMVSMIKKATGARIIVGQNGVVWISCEDPKMELIALNTVKKIEENAHITGLTDKIKEYLDNTVGPIDYSSESSDNEKENQGDNNESL